MTDHKVKKAGSWVTPGANQITAKLAGSWQTVQKVWAKSGGVWVQVWTNYTPMSTPTLSVTTLNDEGIALDNVVTCSGNVSCSTPSGGSGTKTYTWEKVSGTTVNVSGGQAATLSRTTDGQNTQAVYRCKVTDGTGNFVYSNNVTINFTHWKLRAAALPATISDYQNYPNTAEATMTFSRNGNGPAGAWILPQYSSVGDLFDIRFDVASGTVSSGSTQITNLTINTDRYQTVNQSVASEVSSAQSKSATVRVRIQRKTYGGYLFDKSCTLTATAEGNS